MDNLPLVLSVANLCSKSCVKLLERCLDVVVRSNLDMIALEKKLPPDVVKEIVDARVSLGLVSPEDKGFPNIHVRRIHRALDSDDVELVRMLLKEGKTNLDDAYALHYAVEHCDSKITTELLDLALADVNHRNPRGYTVLHIAAMRREPKIIVSLLTKGARPSDLTFDDRKAVQISKRLTKHGDYFGPTEDGKPSPKDRLCIEVLEQAERRDPQLGEASVSLAIEGDSARGRLLYLENRGNLCFRKCVRIICSGVAGGIEQLALFFGNDYSSVSSMLTSVLMLCSCSSKNTVSYGGKGSNGHCSSRWNTGIHPCF